MVWPKPIVWILIFNAFAAAAAVIGSNCPELFIPSVSRITNLLLFGEFFSMFAALASPNPIAVPSSMSNSGAGSRSTNNFLRTS